MIFYSAQVSSPRHLRLNSGHVICAISRDLYNVTWFTNWHDIGSYRMSRDHGHSLSLNKIQTLNAYSSHLATKPRVPESHVVYESRDPTWILTAHIWRYLMNCLSLTPLMTACMCSAASNSFCLLASASLQYHIRDERHITQYTFNFNLFTFIWTHDII